MDRASPRPRKSIVWEYFTKKDKCFATCNACKRDYSSSSLSNLWKHHVNKHGGKPSVSVTTRDVTTDVTVTDNSNNDDTSDEEVVTPPSRRKSTWKYFEVLDSDEFDATCKLCREVVSYDSIQDLTNHVRDHGESPLDCDDPDYLELTKTKKKKFSPVWEYFKDMETLPQRAVCLLCGKILNYSATVTNLKRHISRKHPEQILKSFKKETPKIIISADGQLYEVQSDPNKNENNEIDDNNGKDPIEMDAVYLEDLEESIDQNMPSTSQHSNVKTRNQTKKEREKKLKKREKKTKEQVLSTTNTCSEEEPPSKKRTALDTMESLDYFGQYVVSLLKELPKSVTAQLQNDIITQILNKKIALESQAASKCLISIDAQRQSNITESDPVTFSVLNDISENNESIVVESTETVDTIREY